MKVTINDKEYTLQWGMGALEIYCDTMMCDIEGLSMVLEKNREQNRAVISLIMAAIQNGLELKGKEMDVTTRQLQKFLDEAPAETFTNILQDFMKSKYFGSTIEEYLLSTLSDEGQEDQNTPKKKSRSPR